MKTGERRGLGGKKLDAADFEGNIFLEALADLFSLRPRALPALESVVRLAVWG